MMNENTEQTMANDEFDYDLPPLPEETLKRLAQENKKKKVGRKRADYRDVFTRDELALLNGVRSAEKNKLASLPPEVQEHGFTAHREGGVLGLFDFLEPLFPPSQKKQRMEALENLAGRAGDAQLF